jgi:hypothetical protein
MKPPAAATYPPDRSRGSARYSCSTDGLALRITAGYQLGADRPPGDITN